MHLSAGRLGGLATLGDSVRILEALDFIRCTAGDRPWVVNTSLGRHSGGHRGLSLVEQAMDAMLLEAPGRAIVQSCGNYFRAGAHASGRLLPGQSRVLRWNTGRADVTPNEFEVWYPIGDRFHVSVRSPLDDGMFQAALGEISPILIGGAEVGRIYHRQQDPTGEHHIDIFLRPGAPAGEWHVELTAIDAVDGRFDAWVERDPGCPSCQSRVHPDDFEPRRTLGSICNGRHTVAVGAYDAHDADHPLGSFSSSGPTRDGRQRPNLAAPGVSVLAARSAARGGRNVPALTRKSGTSMAAPHVTGTIALMFEAAPRRLTIRETHQLLLLTTDAAEGDIDFRLRVGNGYLNTSAAVEAAANGVVPFEQEQPHGAEMTSHETESAVPQSASGETTGDQTSALEAERISAEDTAAPLSIVDTDLPTEEPTVMTDQTMEMQECSCGSSGTESTERSEMQPPAEQAAPDSPVANSFVAAHRTRYCVPGQRNSPTCRHLVSPRQIHRVIIHVVGVPGDSRQTGVQKVIRNWQQQHRRASSHYLVDRDGTVTQMVRESDVAFHTPGNNGNNNRDSIGIEHADVCNDPAPLTNRLYEQSAALVRNLASRHGFSITNQSVSGHVDVNSNHADPGPYWDWEYYRQLLAWDGTTASDRPVRIVATAADQSTVPSGWRQRQRRTIPDDRCARSRDPYGSRYWRAAPDPNGTPAELSLMVVDPGVYDVSLWWPKVRRANSTVSVEIEVRLAQSPGGLVASGSTVVNQRRGYGRWNQVLSGFPVGSIPVEVRVRIHRNSTARGRILADAIRVLKIGQNVQSGATSQQLLRRPATESSVVPPPLRAAVDRRWSNVGEVAHSRPTPKQLVRRAAEAIAEADVCHILGPGAVASPALLFDSLSLDLVPGLREQLAARFRVLAFPGENLHRQPRPGDMVVKRALGEGDLAFTEVIVEPCPKSPVNLHARVAPFDAAFRHVETLRLTDTFGRLDDCTLILRPLAGSAKLTSASGEQVAGIDWCQRRRDIERIARDEDRRWTRPNGTKILENDPTMRPVLESYWRTVPGFQTAAAARAKALESANDTPRGFWSAAFICFVMHSAGIRRTDGFHFSQRHMNYIVGALRNRERSRRDRPFWLVDHIEIEHEAIPAPGDILCFNRRVNGAMTRHTYSSLRRSFWSSGNQAVPAHGSSHCSLVVGTVQRGGRRFLQTIGGNEDDSVRLRARIPINSSGGIPGAATHHIFGLIKMIGC